MKRLRFSLRVKLALVLLALAALPLAGILYVNEVERFLLQEQEQSLLAVARAVATALHERPQLLASASGRDDEVDAILLGLQRASSRIWVVDGGYQVIAQAGSLRRHLGPRPILLLTLAAEGYLLDDPAADRVVASVPRTVVDGVPAVGAGDTFGAALAVRYEDLCHDPQRRFPHIAAFLGVDCRPQQFADCVRRRRSRTQIVPSARPSAAMSGAPA